MPKWVWWVLLLIVVVLIWRGQGAVIGHGISRLITGVFTTIGSIKL